MDTFHVVCVSVIHYTLWDIKTHGKFFLTIMNLQKTRRKVQAEKVQMDLGKR